MSARKMNLTDEKKNQLVKQLSFNNYKLVKKHYCNGIWF